MGNEQSPLNEAAIAIRDAIDANPLSKKTPSDFSAEFHVDRNKLLPVFKELTGETIKRYQLVRLMNAAGDMLLSGMTVKEVAIECGYIDYPNNFTRGFRKVFDMGPEEWLHKKWMERRNSNSDRQGQK